MVRRILALVLTAGLVFGGAAPSFAAAGESPVVSKDGKSKGKGKGKKGGKKGKKKGKKGKGKGKKGAKFAPKKPTETAPKKGGKKV